MQGFHNLLLGLTMHNRSVCDLHRSMCLRAVTDLTFGNSVLQLLLTTGLGFPAQIFQPSEVLKHGGSCYDSEITESNATPSHPPPAPNEAYLGCLGRAVWLVVELGSAKPRGFRYLATMELRLEVPKRYGSCTLALYLDPRGETSKLQDFKACKSPLGDAPYTMGGGPCS